MNRKQIMDFYRDNGMGVIRLLGKIPMTKEWQKIGPDNLDAYDYEGNIGASLPPDIVVIDVDPRNFPEGRNPSAELYKVCGMSKQDTLKVTTGTGGAHVYFRKPADITCKKNLDKDGYPGIDIKTMNGEKGGQVVMPTSINPETKLEYVLTDGELSSIKDIPKTLLDIIKKPRVEISEIRTTEVPIGNVEAAMSQYVAWLTSNAPVAIQGQSGDQTTFNVACKGKDTGLDEQNTYFCMLDYWNELCSPEWDDNELLEKVQNAYQYGSEAIGSKSPERLLNDIGETAAREVIHIKWDMQKDGKYTKTLFNTVNFFRLPSTGLVNLLTYNEFTQKIEFTSKPPWQGSFYRETWADEDITACKYHLSSNFQFEIGDKIINEAATIAALENRSHPVRDYLNELIWDGKPRLNTWLHKYGRVENNVYTREVGRKFLVAAVSRIFNPGCKFDYVTVLEGKQGIRKSTLCSILGGEWYAEAVLDPRNKDMVHVMTGKWIIELSEMETSRKSEADALKAFITTSKDRMRMPFARHAVDVKRQCVFIGTINPEAGVGYLKDQTGNRRFWCVEIMSEIDTDGLEEARDQLFAEAVHCYRQGEKLYIEKADVDAMARLESDKRSGGDPWSTDIGDYLKANPKVDMLRAVDFYKSALRGKSIDFGIREKIRVQKAMKQLGWEKLLIKDDATGLKEEVFKRRWYSGKKVKA